MRTRQDEATVRRSVYQRDNARHLDVLAGMEMLFIRMALGRLRPDERILDAFAYYADYLDVTNPFRPLARVRPALACLTKARLVQVYAARGGLALVPTPAWVTRHAEDTEFGAVDLTAVESVCTRRTVRRLGVAHDVVLTLRDGGQHRIGPHSDADRAEIIADRIRHRMRPDLFPP